MVNGVQCEWSDGRRWSMWHIIPYFRCCYEPWIIVRFVFQMERWMSGSLSELMDINGWILSALPRMKDHLLGGHLGKYLRRKNGREMRGWLGGLKSIERKWTINLIVEHCKKFLIFCFGNCREILGKLKAPWNCINYTSLIDWRPLMQLSWKSSSSMRNKALLTTVRRRK